MFVNEPADRVVALVKRLRLIAVQLHGDEPAEYVTSLRTRLPAGCEVWRAVRVSDRIPEPGDSAADRLLLDTYDPTLRGGTGRRFDWSLLRGRPDRRRLVLAGGIDAGNVREAHATGCGALDVSSGVESSPGVKSGARLQVFFDALRGAA